MCQNGGYCDKTVSFLLILKPFTINLHTMIFRMDLFNAFANMVLVEDFVKSEMQLTEN